MGFSSFGAKPNPPKKKRKLGDPNSEGSGSNNIPLGMRSRKQDKQQEEAQVREESWSNQGHTNGLWHGEQTQGGKQQQQQQQRKAVPHQDGLGIPDTLAAEAMDETAAMTGHMPQYLDWSYLEEGGGQDGLNGQGQERVAGRQQLESPDPLAAEAMDETAALLLETGRMPRYLDWGEGAAGGGGSGDGRGRGGGVGGGEMRRVGKRADGEWDWQALRKGVVDERGDVAFYDGSFVEDPWRGLGGETGEGR